MLVFPGSMNFTSHPEVLIAPRAPIDPECAETRDGELVQRPPAPPDVQHVIVRLWLDNQQKEATSGRSLVIPCFNIPPSEVGCFEHSALLTVTSAGVP